MSLDFEQQAYVAREDAAYSWTTGTVDFTTGFYFTVQCWDGDSWKSAWRAFVFDEPGYQSLAIPLGDVPAIGYGPAPGIVAIPSDAPAGTYRLVVQASARDEETGEPLDQLTATGGFVVGVSTPPSEESRLVLVPEDEFFAGARFTVTSVDPDGIVGGYVTLEQWKGEEGWTPVVAVMIAEEHLGETRTIPIGENWGTEDVGYNLTTFELPPELEPGSYRVCTAQAGTECGMFEIGQLDRR